MAIYYIRTQRSKLSFGERQTVLDYKNKQAKRQRKGSNYTNGQIMKIRRFRRTGGTVHLQEELKTKKKGYATMHGQRGVKSSLPDITLFIHTRGRNSIK